MEVIIIIIIIIIIIMTIHTFLYRHKVVTSDVVEVAVAINRSEWRQHVAKCNPHSVRRTKTTAVQVHPRPQVHLYPC